MKKRNLREELENASSDYPDPWRPTEGEILVGKVVEDNMVLTKNGESQVLKIVEDDTGKPWALWITHTVLKSEIEALAPRVGDHIGVRYLGKEPTKGYHRWRVVVDRNSDSEE